MILVTAGNGRTGRAVIQALARRGQRIRAFDISTSVKETVAIGATEAMVGDLLSPDDVARAVDGITAVVYIAPPLHPREAEMGHGVITAARRARVKHFVQFSVLHPQLEPLLNHQSKLSVERVLLTSRLPFTILQPMQYMQNIDVAGVVEKGMLTQPYALDIRLAHVDLDDVAEVAALVVNEPAHYYATYELCGSDFLNAHELADIMTEVSGKRVLAEQMDPEFGPLSFGSPSSGGNSSEEQDYRRDALFRLFDHYGHYGFTGNPNVLRWLLGRAPTTFAEYVQSSLAGGVEFVGRPVAGRFPSRIPV